jgi:hypothetical protein
LSLYSPSRYRLWGSPAEGSGSRSGGSSEVQALACLPSPSHRKSSSLAQTSPGAAPGAYVGGRLTGVPSLSPPILSKLTFPVSYPKDHSFSLLGTLWVPFPEIPPRHVRYQVSLSLFHCPTHVRAWPAKGPVWAQGLTTLLFMSLSISSRKSHNLLLVFRTVENSWGTPGWESQPPPLMCHCPPPG